jgi:hypothetical protein
LLGSKKNERTEYAQWGPNVLRIYTCLLHMRLYQLRGAMSIWIVRFKAMFEVLAKRTRHASIGDAADQLDDQKMVSESEP